MWRYASLLVILAVAGCSSSGSDDASVKDLPAQAPVTKEQQSAAQSAVANDPKAAADAPRPDGS